jgi:hypothetical protein
MVVATHFATVGNNHGYLFGTAETTLAAAMAFGLFTPLIAIRIIEFSNKLSGSRATVAVMIGTIVLLAGGAPLQLMAFHLDRQAAVLEASFSGYAAATTVGRLAEKQPQDARQIGILVGSEFLRRSLAPTSKEDLIKGMDERIADGWKKIGFEKSPMATPVQE